MSGLEKFFEKAAALIAESKGELDGHSPVTQFVVSHIPADFDIYDFTIDLKHGLAQDHAGKADVGYLRTGHAYRGNKLFISFDTPQPFAFTVPVVGAALQAQTMRRYFRLSILDIAVSDAPSESLLRPDATRSRLTRRSL